MITGRDCNCEDFPCCGHGFDAEAEARATVEYMEQDERDEWEDERHYSGCICADCSGAELTARND